MRWGVLIVCMILASLIAATSIHVTELPGTVDIDCAVDAHDRGDPVQSSDDTDKALSHHHGGCHGVAAFLPGKDVAAGGVALLMASPIQPKAASLGLWISGPDLKPPMA